MAEIEDIAADIRKRLDGKESAREAALRTSRQIIRECRSAMATLQRGGDGKKSIEKARADHSHLREILSDYPDLLSAGYAVDAEQEISEVEILYSIMRGKKIPSPRDLEVSDEAFVLGMADCIGELRRLMLDGLMKDDVEGAKEMLAEMERLFDILMTFDYPDALVSTKRKQDIARGVVEKSRGEIAMAAQMSHLKRRLRR